MTRTKYKKTSKTRGKVSTSKKLKPVLETSAEDFKEELTSMLISSFENDFCNAICSLKRNLSTIIDEIESVSNYSLVSMNEQTCKKTIGEYRREKSFSVYSFKSTIFETASLLKQLNSTTNTTLSKKKKQTDDEGYLTAGESGNGDGLKSRTRSSSTARENRQKERTESSKRVSRSLSRSQVSKKVKIQAPEKKTPDRMMRPPLSFGAVTPKMKPNMSVSVLRRPKQGEMAISMQGSPLLVSGVVTESCANVNIPLDDGRVLSLQPSKNLRMSEIPDIDEVTRQQLATLRDNLNKFVKITTASDK